MKKKRAASPELHRCFSCRRSTCPWKCDRSSGWPKACSLTDKSLNLANRARSKRENRPKSIGQLNNQRGPTRSHQRGKKKEDAVNWEQTKGKWNQTKGAVKKQWGKLTDDDLTVIAGQRDQLVGKIQERYGIEKEEADKQVKTWESMKVSEPEEFESEEKRKAS
jgi:uncharacterized protein YjbJ (UPF0337 family)